MRGQRKLSPDTNKRKIIYDEDENKFHFIMIVNWMSIVGNGIIYISSVSCDYTI